MSATDPTIAIVGAGIGGLTLGIELRRRGFAVEIYEQTDELREVGAAVALSANATRFYIDRFGLEPQLKESWNEINGLVYRDGASGQVIGRHLTREEYRSRFGAPYIGIHRADLQAVLSDALGPESLHLGKRLTAIDDTGSRCHLAFDDGSTAVADLVIGADGVRSTVRRWLLGYDDALFTGCTGTRGIVAPELLSELPDPDTIQFWIGPGRHLLHYPIGSGEQNFLLVQRGPAPWSQEAWVTPIENGSHVDGFQDWHPAVVQMITAVPVTQRWALFHRPPLRTWSRGRVTLLGDAAHAMAPHHGQGAGQSIEDAIVLADLLAGTTDWNHARAEYERRRAARTRKVQFASITAADVLHLADGPRAERRNARLADVAGFDRHYTWIHAFKADEDSSV